MLQAQHKIRGMPTRSRVTVECNKGNRYCIYLPPFLTLSPPSLSHSRDTPSPIPNRIIRGIHVSVSPPLCQFVYFSVCTSVRTAFGIGRVQHPYLLCVCVCVGQRACMCVCVCVCGDINVDHLLSLTTAAAQCFTNTACCLLYYLSGTTWLGSGVKSVTSRSQNAGALHLVSHGVHKYVITHTELHRQCSF